MLSAGDLNSFVCEKVKENEKTLTVAILLHDDDDIFCDKRLESLIKLNHIT